MERYFIYPFLVSTFGTFHISFLFSIDNAFRNADTKWPSKTAIAISEKLLKCRIPREIVRTVRGLDVIKQWKATEFRTFLLYTGIVVLKDHLSFEVYQHFLLLFCAVTICETRQFSHLLPLAKAMLDHFIELFREIYGEAYITSNVHNLVHLVEEVIRYGELQSFSAYPFESMLGTIKKMLRNGNSPLAQVARRIIEMTRLESTKKMSEPSKKNVVLTKLNKGENVPHTIRLGNTGNIGFYSKIQFGDFCLGTDAANKWFLTRKNEIVCVENILSIGDKISLYCHTVTNQKDFFETPIKSSALNIYVVDFFAYDINEYKLFNVSDIKCKLVRVEYGDTGDVFIPMLHTYVEKTL